MLWCIDALNVAGRLKVTHKLVGGTQAVVAWPTGILDIAYHPIVMTSQLEGRHALAFLLALKADVVVFYGFAPRSCQVLGSSGKQSRLSTLLFYHHMPLLVAVEPVDVGIDGGIAPVEEQLGLRQLGERLVSIRIVHAVVFLFVAVPHRVVDEVTALAPVGPCIFIIPLYLRSPHAIHC